MFCNVQLTCKAWKIADISNDFDTYSKYSTCEMSWYCTALIARNQETAPVDVNIWQKLIRSDNLWSVLTAAFVLIKEIALPMKCDQMILFWWIIPGFMFFWSKPAGKMHISHKFSNKNAQKTWQLKQFPHFSSHILFRNIPTKRIKFWSRLCFKK